MDGYQYIMNHLAMSDIATLETMMHVTLIQSRVSTGKRNNAPKINNHTHGIL